MENNFKIDINESKRLDALHSYGIINNQSVDFLDKVTSLAANLCNVPISLISMVDEKDQWFVSRTGIKIKSTPRFLSFCHHAIQQDDIFEINDTHLNPVFASNPLVTGSFNLRFYAGVPLKDPEGFNIGTLCVIDNVPRNLNELEKSSLKILAQSVMDFIVLKKSQRELSNSHSQLNTFFNLSPDLLCTASFDGYFKTISAAFTKELGYSEKELLGAPLLDFVHEDDKAKTLEVMKDLDIKSEKVYFFRNRYHCKDGNYIWLSWNAIPNEEAGLIFATARNVTTLLSMQEEVERNKHIELKLNNEKYSQLCELTLKISHEILNPINLIIGYADVTLNLLNDIEKINSEKENLEIFNDIVTDQKKIIGHGRYIFNLIQRMNFNVNDEYAPRLFHQVHEDHVQEVNLLCSEFTDIAYSNFMSRVKGFKCEIEKCPDNTDPKVKVSITDFGEAFLNVLYNAFEAMIEKQSGNLLYKPKVTVQISSQNGFAEIRIKNNGTPIKKENFSKILNPFFTTKTANKGRGLGLTTTYGIIRKNGGMFSFKKSDNEETEFIILLPLAA